MCFQCKNSVFKFLQRAVDEVLHVICAARSFTDFVI